MEPQTGHLLPSFKFFASSPARLFSSNTSAFRRFSLTASNSSLARSKASCFFFKSSESFFLFGRSVLASFNASSLSAYIVCFSILTAFNSSGLSFNSSMVFLSRIFFALNSSSFEASVFSSEAIVFSSLRTVSSASFNRLLSRYFGSSSLILSACL